MLKKIQFHHYLFAVLPLLIFFNFNKSEIYIGDSMIQLLLGISLLISLILFVVLLVLFRNRRMAALFTTYGLFILLSYGHLHHYADRIDIHTPLTTIGPDKVLFMLFGGVGVIAALLFMKNKWLLKKATHFANVFTLLLFAFTTFSIGWYYATSEFTYTEQRGAVTQKSKEEEVNTAQSAQDYPDVYYIIPDSFPSFSALEEYFNHDPTWLVSSLEAKGFTVNETAYTHYPHTHISLPSTLNMTYLNYLSEEHTSGDRKAVYGMMKENPVISTFKERGYTFVFFPNLWTPMQENDQADIVYNGDLHSTHIGPFFFTLNELTITYLKTTALKPYIENLTHDVRRGRELYKFKKLEEIARVPGPKFVLLHILPPHPPYIFGRNGEVVPQSVNKVEDMYINKERYLDQIIFVGKMLDRSLGKVLANSEKEPIIILQSDHGTPTELGRADRWQKTTFENDLYGMRERMSILQAYYIPEQYKDEFEPLPVPVNTFRTVFNTVFEEGYEILPRKHYFMYDIRAYEYDDITELLLQ